MEAEVVGRVLQDEQLVGDAQLVEVLGEFLVALGAIAVALDLHDRHAAVLEGLGVGGRGSTVPRQPLMPPLANTQITGARMPFLIAAATWPENPAESELSLPPAPCRKQITG